MNNAAQRATWVDYLRSFITVLVVAHHSSLAYTTFASFSKPDYISSTHPVVDSHRWVGLDKFEDFNDVFFMSLMFFISGLFAIPALERKKTGAFLKDRFYRLFIPFLFGVTILMLLAYYPSFYLATGNRDIKAYVIDFFTVEAWPVGPPWFIWVLFAITLLFALVFLLFKDQLKKTALLISRLKNRPWLFFISFLVFTWITYVPLRIVFGAHTWTGFGPFDFQLSRPLLYFGYFVAGALAGTIPWNDGLFADDSRLVKNWLLWVAASLLVYAGLTMIGSPLLRMVESGKIELFTAQLLYGTVYSLSIVCSCLAFLTVFKKWVSAEKPWWQSLSANAYAIYLLHYIFVLWYQFLLLEVDCPAFVKFSIVFISSLLTSWLVSHLFRKIKLVRKFL